MVATRAWKIVSIAVLLSSLCSGLSVAAESMLFQIGQADNDTTEFALGPNQYAQYSEAFPHDTIYVVGQSDPRKDWPYVHPGPVDGWAGGQNHTASIVFGVESVPASGSCKLHMDFVDMHRGVPPRLEIKVNGRLFTRHLPAGAGDASVYGEPDKGREHRMTIEFPVRLIRTGTNTITIANTRGSWCLYDCISLATPASVRLGALTEVSELIDVSTGPLLVRQGGRLFQPVFATLLRIGEPVEATVTVEGSEPATYTLQSGYTTVEGLVPAVERPTTVDVTVAVTGEPLARRSVEIAPVRKWEIYILHHSHVDIGYTHVQTDVLQKHYEYFDQVIELARKSAQYPEGSQFKWNAEVLWAVDSYLREASPEKREAFIDAVRKGWIGLDALYGNELTALCRPEELVRLVDFAGQMRSRYNVTIDSAMITDVPGYTWGLVPVLGHTPVKYFCVGPNRGHRTGSTLPAWGDKPFYWVSPCGQYKILTWVAGEGYSLFHSGQLNSDTLFEYLDRLERAKYPYDMLQIRYSIGGDNGPPDPGLADFAREWNEKYAYPRLVVATTSEMFSEFEKRYGEDLPVVAGDFTPYWEDGAASSARETIINRAAAERLVQAETLFAMLQPGDYPAEEFYQAWRNVILYDEHTWGAHNSISQPEGDFALSQWKIKQAFALDAETQSDRLLKKATSIRSASAGDVTTIDVFNTCSWPRTDLVTVPGTWNRKNLCITNAGGEGVPSQRLTSGELVFLAGDIPPFGAKRFLWAAKPAGVSTAPASAAGTRLANGLITVIVDEKTGAIASLKYKDAEVDLAGADGGVQLNDYFYVRGRDPRAPERNGPVRITVKEKGPLVASLLIESGVPGARKLVREIRLVAGLDRLDIIDTIDKTKIYQQEGVHIAFAFNVPGGVVRMDTPWAIVRPELDQIPGACKNYFTVQRWVDVSNDRYGLTWATPDAPLIEIGRITTDAPTVGWIDKLEPSTTVYSYVMNNYWETNYKATQEGPTTFRYSIRPHRGFDAAQATRFGTEASQPLVAVPNAGRRSVCASLLHVQPADVVASVLKPSRDGKAWILRLFNPTEKPHKVTLAWGKPAPKKVFLSNFAEEEGRRMREPAEIGPYEIVTVRAQLP
ncbi:MAG: hypothetical protein JW741_16235 [Sedimentisphaerales bacterium]|nr:hypothetical protein [Sedimentisphaerales bacterium]